MGSISTRLLSRILVASLWCAAREQSRRRVRRAEKWGNKEREEERDRYKSSGCRHAYHCRHGRGKNDK